MTELFNIRELREPLTREQCALVLSSIVSRARLGGKYFYTLKESAGLLHWSYDQIFDAVHFYRLDAVRLLGLVRVPWWSLAEYLLDPAEEVDAALAAYLDALPRREM